MKVGKRMKRRGFDYDSVGILIPVGNPHLDARLAV